MFDQITVVVGVDAKTLPQFEVSHRTWKLHHPEMWRWPWVVFYDGDNLSLEAGIKREIDEGAIPAGAEVVPWPHCLGLPKKVKYETQRERMLSGHVFVPPRVVKTDWYLKIDTDAVCLRRSEAWPNEKWFVADQETKREPVVIAPSWHYSKGVGLLDRLEEWGNAAPQVSKWPALNISHNPTHLRVPHPRWCSWLSFYRTAWARAVIEMLEAPGKLPVPSQDSFHWYVAERMRENVVKVNMKALGWTNCSKMNSLVETVRKVMGGEEAMVDG